MSTEKIALALRDHQSELDDWPYAGLARALHRWIEIFDQEFRLSLPSYPVVRFSPLRNAYATYAWFRNGVGTRDNITFNTHELQRDPALILRTLCHELLHLWQHYHGMPGRSNYHNREFIEMASTCGLIVDHRGCTSGHTSLFTAVLTKHGVKLDPLIVLEAPEQRVYGAARREQPMKKYVCGCTIVRCATTLDARCNLCGASFLRS